MDALPVMALAISASTLAVAIGSVLLSQRQLRVAERHRRREFGATVVAELLSVQQQTSTIDYTVCVTNVGPAVARDVDVSMVRWTDSDPFGLRLCEAAVAPALARGEQRTVVLALPVDEACFDERSVAIDLGADYYDDEGIRKARLALVLDDTLIHLPPALAT